ncbi:MAG TPA: hypothetical protein VF883_22470, partial [Thermoanaerobaculia bacterium]
PRNNPIQQFDRYFDIEEWLREQWAGLFRELLHRGQTHAQLTNLQAQVGELAELNATMKTYLEQVVTKVAPEESRQLISTEAKRLQDVEVKRLVLAEPLGDLLHITFNIPADVIISSAAAAASLQSFFERVVAATAKGHLQRTFDTMVDESHDRLLEDLNAMKRIIGAREIDPVSSTSATARRRRARSKK